ncbi:hypothetical protein J3F83DRAFT_760768 [Trichoderma novae-zelandiae]
MSPYTLCQPYMLDGGGGDGGIGRGDGVDDGGGGGGGGGAAAGRRGIPSLKTDNVAIQDSLRWGGGVGDGVSELEGGEDAYLPRRFHSQQRTDAWIAVAVTVTEDKAGQPRFMPVVLAYFRRQDIDNPNVAPAQSYLMDKTRAQLSIMTATSSLLTAESSTTGAESSATSTPVDKPRCTHYIPCHCPSLPEYASPPLGDESSPVWLRRPHEDEDHNKTIIKRTQSSRYRRIAAAWHDAWLAIKINRPLRPLRPPTPLQVRSFQWLISADLIPRGYEDGQAPWRMLIRSYLTDLPLELIQGGDSSRKSIFLWPNFPRYLGKLHNRKKLDNAPPEITCGRRAVYSRSSRDYNHTLIGNWLVIVYIWATDKTWMERTDFLDLVSYDSVTGIRAWEFVDAVDDTSTKIPHLFYQYQIRDSIEQDAIYAGHPYQHYNSVQIKPGDPVPARLAGLRRLMNGRARHLYCAPYELEMCKERHSAL